MKRRTDVTYTGQGHHFEMSRFQFQYWLRTTKATEVHFQYSGNVNDELNPCGTYKKRATYEVVVRTDVEGLLIVYKDHMRSHDEVEEEVIAKYTRWAKQVFDKQALEQLDKLNKEVDVMETELDKIAGMPKSITKIEDKIKYIK